jgi:hypothetical protein
MRTIIVQFDELGIERDDGKSCGSFTGQVEILVGEPEADDYEAYGDTYVPVHHGASWSVGDLQIEWTCYDRDKGWSSELGPPPAELLAPLKTAFIVHYTPIIEERIAGELAA